MSRPFTLPGTPYPLRGRTSLTGAHSPTQAFLGEAIFTFLSDFVSSTSPLLLQPPSRPVPPEPPFQSCRRLAQKTQAAAVTRPSQGELQLHQSPFMRLCPPPHARRAMPVPAKGQVRVPFRALFPLPLNPAHPKHLCLPNNCRCWPGKVKYFCTVSCPSYLSYSFDSKPPLPDWAWTLSLPHIPPTHTPC